MNKKVVITEWGWTTDNFSNNKLRQAERQVSGLLSVYYNLHGINTIFLYEAYDYGTDGDDIEHVFGFMMKPRSGLMHLSLTACAIEYNTAILVMNMYKKILCL